MTSELIREIRAQLTDLAFTTTGHAVEFHCEGRQTKKVVQTMPCKSMRYFDRLETLAAEDLKSESAEEALFSAYLLLAPDEPYNFNTHETTEHARKPRTVKAIIVGLALSPHPKLKETISNIRRHPKGTRNKAIRHERPDQTIVLDELTSPPMIVVTPIEQKKRHRGKLFVLLDDGDDLCTPYRIAWSEVFYFSEYRDHEMAASFRRSTWTEKLVASARNVADGTIESVDIG